MKESEPLKEILDSWQRCIERDLMSIGYLPVVKLNEAELQSVLSENGNIIYIFEKLFETLKEFLNTDKCSYLLISRDGILIKKKGNKRVTKRMEDYGFYEGMSFLEEDSGTNAVAMAMLLQKPVCVSPQHHFCEFLKDWYSYVAPIIVEGNPVGFLALNILEQDNKWEMTVITILLANKIADELVNLHNKKSQYSESAKSINSIQCYILKLFAKGLTEKAVALEIKRNIGTVRYHKLNIFNKLEAGCTLEAVVKALKLGLISLDDIDIPI